MTHICVLSRSTVYHSGYGGMEIVANDLVRSFVDMGIDVTVLTTALSKTQLESKCFKVDGMQVCSLGGMPPMKYSSSWWRKSAEALQQLDQQKKVDLVFSVSAAAYGALSKKELINVPFVFQAHGTALAEFKAKLSLSWKGRLSAVVNLRNFLTDIRLIPKFDLVVAIGPKVYEDYKKSPVILNRRIALISNAVDGKVFKFEEDSRYRVRHELGLPAQTTVFISASRLSKEKNIPFILQTFYEITKRKDDVHLLLVGDGPQRSELQAAIDRMHLDGKTTFLGHIPRDQVKDFYSAADFMIFPGSRIEGLPLTILEAMSSSVVCFTSKYILPGEEVPVGRISISSSQDAAISILSHIDESDWVQRLKRCAKKYVDQNFGYGAWAEKYIEQFQELGVDFN